jgi:serine/threonine protein kinase
MDDSHNVDARESDSSLTDPSDIPSPLVDHPRYRILERIGEGGMGVVYKAEHRVMGRMVALKVLTAGLSSNTTAMDRFRREVRLASRLSHPNIVTAYDADEVGGLHFLVMEFVEGMSLEKLIQKQGLLSVPVACEFIRQAAIGLQHAHEKGMVHRDIKPHNLMLTRTGQIKILDFGLARVANVEGAAPTSMTAMAITQPHTVMGTPDFFSPEQAKSVVNVDIRSDIYSLGCTLYYLLAGKPPFEGNGVYAKMIAHFKEPPPELTVARPDAPKKLADVLRKLLAKSPDDRYQTPAEVATALLPFSGTAHAEVPTRTRQVPTSAETQLNDRNTVSSELPMATEIRESVAVHETTPSVTKHRRWLPTLAALLVLGLGLAGLAVWMNRDEESAGPIIPLEPSATTPKPPSSSGPAPTTPPRPVHTVRKKQVLFLIPAEFAQGEFNVASTEFKHLKVGILTVGPEKKTLQGQTYSQGTRTPAKTLEPDYGVKDITDSILDSVDGVLLIPGESQSFGPKGTYADDVYRMISKLLQKKKVIGAIGSGVVVLGGHGFLENSSVSSMPNRPKTEARLKVKNWLDEPKVVIDLPFITSGVFTHAKEVTDEISKAIPDPHQK